MNIDLSKSISVESKEFNAISSNLQGNILKSHGRDHAAHVFIRFKDPVSAKKYIKNIAVRMTSARQQKIDSKAFKQGTGTDRKDFKSLSISRLGYGFLGIPQAKQPSDSSFQAGMKSQGSNLNDPESKSWESAYKVDYHAVLIIANKSQSTLKRRVKDYRNRLKKITSQLHIELGAGIRNKQNAHIEHFGYVDGISQPHLLNDKINSGKTPTNNWNPEDSLDLALVPDPGTTRENTFGSYLVFRKLHQDVDGWNNAVVSLSNKLKVDPHFLGAQLVGRFKSGTPLIPVIPPQAGPSSSMNDFNYNSDPSGSKCPFHAHIRKTNPRGNGGFEKLEDEKRHLFVRRGITYGKRGTQDVGLLFMAYNSNIASQFEFMQSAWANNVNFPNQTGKPHGLDPVIGQARSTRDSNTSQNHSLSYGGNKKRDKIAFANFVTLKGGEYFFTPSIPFLRSL